MDLKDFEQFALEFTTLSNEPEIDIKISPLSAWCLIAQLQLALRHPENTGLIAQHARDVATALQSRIPLSEGMRSIMDMGWNKEYDAPISETLENFLNRVPTRQIIEVHNAYTIYGLNPDGTEVEQPILSFSRPQDWGNPRWHYEQFKFEWVHEDKHYINHAYCWTDLPKPEQGYPSLFGEVIAVYILSPGSRASECGRSHLKQDDFWSVEWGKMPPYFDPDWDEDEERLEFEAEYVNEDDEDEM